MSSRAFIARQKSMPDSKVSKNELPLLIGANAVGDLGVETNAYLPF